MSNYPPGAEHDPRAPWNATEEPCPHRGMLMGECPACRDPLCDECVSRVEVAVRGVEGRLCTSCATFLTPCCDCMEPRQILYDGRCDRCEAATAGPRS